MSSYDEKNVLDIIEKVTKSVVNISSVKLVHNIFYQAVPVAGMGSGTIIDSSKGLVLTNNHVVGGAEKINVTLWNGEVLEGIIEGSCVAEDIAVLRVRGTNLQSRRSETLTSCELVKESTPLEIPSGWQGGHP